MSNAAAVFDSQAAGYDAARRRLIPPYDAFYGTAVEALELAEWATTGGRERLRVLDLGAGTGLLAAHVRARFPHAELTLLDGAPAMLEQARTRLGEDVATVVADLAEPLPAGPWEAIVSSLAIHHLPDAGKQRLYARVHDELGAGGVFVNAEHVAGPTALFDQHYMAWHEAQARALGADDEQWGGYLGRRANDRCASVERQLGWLRDAGFADVDVLFKDRLFAVLVARRAG